MVLIVKSFFLSIPCFQKITMQSAFNLRFSASYSQSKGCIPAETAQLHDNYKPTGDKNFHLFARNYERNL